MSLIDDNHLDRVEVEALAFQRCGKGPNSLDRKEASVFVEAMFQMAGAKQTNGSRPHMPGSSSLYQPVYLGVREDIDPSECLEGQLKYKAA